MDLGRLWLGLVVVAFGIVFLLDSAGALDADRAIDDWWPLLLVSAGVMTFAERPPSLLRGTLLTSAGAVLLLFSTDLVEGDGWSYVWPTALIVLGLTVVGRWHGRTITRGASEEEVVRSTAVFGGPKLVCTAQRFRGVISADDPRDIQ